MAASDVSGGIQFIMSTDVNKSDPQTRKLIRSHVMRGKNRRSSSHLKQQRVTSRTATLESSQSQRVSLDKLIERCSSVVPRRVGSDLSFINFADEIESATVMDILEFASISMRAMFPLVVFINFNNNDKMWFHLLTIDAAYLHITVFGIETFISKVTGRKNHTTIQEPALHLLKGLQLLRKKLLLSDEDAKISDSTVLMVLTLVISALAVGEIETAKHHMEGIRTMVNLRGGLVAFKGKKLLMEMLRNDLSIALHGGLKPIFFNDPFLEPFMPFPDQKLWTIRTNNGKLHSQRISQSFLSNIDQSLAPAWETMRGFCSIVDLASESERMLSQEITIDTVASVMYRLLQMSFKVDSIDEAVRLGLLAMSYHLFLQWQDMNLSNLQFASNYKSYLRSVKPGGILPSQFILWLLMVGKISILNNADDAWLRSAMNVQIDLCGLKSWMEVRDILKSFIWIGSLHDKKGRKIFESILKF